MAANQGNAIAQNNLGAMYYAGEGTRKNKAEAFKWFFIAAELGNDDAGDNRDLAAEDMRSSQIKKATRMAQKWLIEFEEKSPDL